MAEQLDHEGVALCPFHRRDGARRDTFKAAHLRPPVYITGRP
jgi:hypothetical protein